jgi:hypothetical protein
MEPPPVSLKKAGAFFTTDELLAVFPRLKRQEASLKAKERMVLLKMEKILYEHVSVQELEEIENNSE